MHIKYIMKQKYIFSAMILYYILHVQPMIKFQI